MPAVASTSSAGAASTSAAPYQPTSRGRPVPIRRSQKACLYCKKSKARCDGPELWPCRRCRESCVDCVFEGVPASELGSKTRTASPGEHGYPSPLSPVSDALDRRLAQVEMELASLRRTTDSHSARFRMLEPAGTTDDSPRLPLYAPDRTDDPMEELHANDELARAAFDTFWLSLAPWAPYIDPVTDTYVLLQQRSRLLLFVILAVTSRFHANAQFAQFAEQQALAHMRATLYSDVPPTLDDLKGSCLYNAWLSRGAPPGHSLSLALQLELPRTLEKLLQSISRPVEEATRAFDELMPSVRTWLCLYAQDLWLSVATGRRSMVNIDFSISSARSLLKFGALRPVDARMVAQSELVTILGGVQDSFVKTQQTSVADAVDIVAKADDHINTWFGTWSDWARLQETSTGTYMEKSFAMQLHVGRFYIATLGLREIQNPEDVQAVQIPVIKTSCEAALQIMKVSSSYGEIRMRHATEFVLISSSSAALFLLKMCKLFPEAVPDIPAAVAAVRNTSRLLAGAPRQNYHLAVAGAVNHFEQTMMHSTFEPPAALVPPPLQPMASGGIEPDDSVLFDPDLELAISSVVGSDSFWSWTQSLPADSFAGILS